MKIICCYTTLQDQVRNTLPKDTRYYKMLNDEHYHNAFVEVWREKETFIIVEHDVVVPQDRLKEIWDCPQPWCTIPYPYIKSQPPNDYLVMEGLGAAKFHESLMRLFPSIVRQTELAAKTDYLTYPPRDWHVLDTRVAIQLFALGYHAHHHMPPIDHLH